MVPKTHDWFNKYSTRIKQRKIKFHSKYSTRAITVLDIVIIEAAREH